MLHVQQDLEFMQVKWATEIEEVKRIQRQEYREFVLKYYAEHEAELARERQRPAVEGPTSPVPVEPGTPPSAVKELQDMGFGAAQAECALMLADGNRDEAITILLERPHQVEVCRPDNQTEPFFFLKFSPLGAAANEQAHADPRPPEDGQYAQASTGTASGCIVALVRDWLDHPQLAGGRVVGTVQDDRARGLCEWAQRDRGQFVVACLFGGRRRRAFERELYRLPRQPAQDRVQYPPELLPAWRPFQRIRRCRAGDGAARADRNDPVFDEPERDGSYIIFLYFLL